MKQVYTTAKNSDVVEYVAKIKAMKQVYKSVKNSDGKTTENSDGWRICCKNKKL